MACFLLALPEDVLPRWACPALRPTEALALFKTCRAMRAAPLTDPWREGWNAWLRARARAWAGARAMHTVPQARDAALLHRACALGDAEAACALLVFGVLGRWLNPVGPRTDARCGPLGPTGFLPWQAPDAAMSASLAATPYRCVT